MRADSRTEPGTADGDQAPQLAAEVEALRRALAAAVAESQAGARQLRAHQREREQTRSAVVSGLKTLRDQLERVARSRAWRYGHGVTKAMAQLGGRRMVTEGGVAAAIGQVDRLLGLLGSPPQPFVRRPARFRGLDRLPASRGDELLLGGRLRGHLGPVPSSSASRSVSIVIVSTSAKLTQAVLDQIADVEYADLETIVVDNASPAGAVLSCAERHARVQVTVRRLENPASYAHANNLGAEQATGELLVFLNDDVRGLEQGWLQELVGSAGPECDVIVGATLVDPRPAREANPGGNHYVLEQRGIALEHDGSEFVLVRREEGQDVLGGSFGTDVPSLAVSGACMLISRTIFASLGGFDVGYQYGLEDVDLCLRARARGLTTVCSGRAVVVHEGASSQDQAGREFRRINRELNHQRLHRLWGACLYREGLEGRLRGERLFRAEPHLGIVRTSNDPDAGWGDFFTAMELGDAAASLGWRVTFVAQRDDPSTPIPADLDLAVVLLDRFDSRTLPPLTVAFAWVRNWTERWLERPWLERYDVLLASSERSRRLLLEATGRPVELFPLATNGRRFRTPAPRSRPTIDWVFTGNRWGTERAIERALEGRHRDRGAIFGRGWDRAGTLRRLTRGSISYEQLPDLYGGAKVVLDDTAEPALHYDAVNARVFDALAAGTPVITNCARGVADLFDDEFPTWSSRQDLDERLDALLAHPAQRAEVAARYRRMVLANHTYDHRIRQLRRIARASLHNLSFCLKVGAPDFEQAQRWGDLHVAYALGRALRRLGHRWRVEVLPEWESSEGSTFDVTVHLRGRSDYVPAPGQFNVLWLISHPDELDPETVEGYDLACVASSRFAEQLQQSVSTHVHVLEQATDARLFYPDPQPALAHQLAFVGNARGVRRKILDDLLPTDHDLAIWGLGWEGTAAERYRIAEYVPNEQLRCVYSSAEIVLCDHWPDMRAAGFRSNRLYDALACGALVVSDDVAGLDGFFGDAVVTYAATEDLQVVIEQLLADPEERTLRTAGARERVLAAETFDHRARELVARINDAR